MFDRFSRFFARGVVGIDRGRWSFVRTGSLCFSMSEETSAVERCGAPRHQSPAFGSAFTQTRSVLFLFGGGGGGVCVCVGGGGGEHPPPPLRPGSQREGVGGKGHAKYCGGGGGGRREGARGPTNPIESPQETPPRQAKNFFGPTKNWPK